MRERDELPHLRRSGVGFDYYLTDAFWYAKDGAGRQSPWPNGPERWLAICRQNGIKRGLWFGTNRLVQLERRRNGNAARHSLHPVDFADRGDRRIGGLPPKRS